MQLFYADWSLMSRRRGVIVGQSERRMSVTERQRCRAAVDVIRQPVERTSCFFLPFVCCLVQIRSMSFNKREEEKDLSVSKELFGLFEWPFCGWKGGTTYKKKTILWVFCTQSVQCASPAAPPAPPPTTSTWVWSLGLCTVYLNLPSFSNKLTKRRNNFHLHHVALDKTPLCGTKWEQ